MGFETNILGSTWNVDIWFFNSEIITKSIEYCDNIANKAKADKAICNAIIAIKQELSKTEKYGKEFTSADVYTAVTDFSVRSLEDFYKWKSRFDGF